MSQTCTESPLCIHKTRMTIAASTCILSVNCNDDCNHNDEGSNQTYRSLLCCVTLTINSLNLKRCNERCLVLLFYQLRVLAAVNSPAERLVSEHGDWENRIVWEEWVGEKVGARTLPHTHHTRTQKYNILQERTFFIGLLTFFHKTINVFIRYRYKY